MILSKETGDYSCNSVFRFHKIKTKYHSTVPNHYSVTLCRCRPLDVKTQSMSKSSPLLVGTPCGIITHQEQLSDPTLHGEMKTITVLVLLFMFTSSYLQDIKGSCQNVLYADKSFMIIITE